MGLVTLGQLEKLQGLSAFAMPTTCLCGNRTAPVGRISSPHSIDFRNPKKGHMSPLLRKADDQCAHVVSGCGNNREGKRGDMINAGNGIITGWPKPSMMMDRLEAEM